MLTATTVEERAPIKLDCKGDKATIDKSGLVQYELLIDGKVAKQTKSNQEKYKMTYTIDESSYTKHHGKYVCKIEYLVNNNKDDVFVSSLGTDVTIKRSLHFYSNFL
jgi:hypothetical protein